MATKGESKQIPFGDIAKGLNQAFDHADPQRLAGLQTLQRVRASKDNGFTREQARLSAKLGPEHPRVTALAVKLQANQELKRDIALGISRAQTPVAAAEADAWIVHGYVRNRARIGLPNLTVGLYDQKNQWIEELGYTCTDANGYFRLRHEGAKAGTAVEATAAASGGPVFIRVLDKPGHTLHADTQPLTPQAGRVDYREIVLNGDGGRCQAPEATPAPTPGKERTGRYLGNSAKREVHDTKNITSRCQIDEIKADHRVYFATQKEAIEAGYDYCAYCFGKDKSRR